ncbi:MAG: OmpH family outer membrane protein [Desulfobulbaceae bacterium]|jgi:outer membrane protein|nr:OmpH family outer membrane protein [Desulfobulbaceae bacterium]
MKMSRFVALVAVSCMFCVGALSSSVQAESKIAFVSVQAVLFGSEDGKVAQGIIGTRQRELQKKFEAEDAKLQALAEEIEKSQSVWSPAVLKEKQREAGMMNRDLKVKADDANYEVNELKKKHLQPIIGRLDGVLKTFGKDNGYTMIIDSDVASRSGMIVFGDPELDITEDLVKLLDAAK